MPQDYNHTKLFRIDIVGDRFTAHSIAMSRPILKPFILFYYDHKYLEFTIR